MYTCDGLVGWVDGLCLISYTTTYRLVGGGGGGIFIITIITSQLQLDGYQMIPQGWSCSTKGGLIIYLQDQYDYIYKNKLIGYESWEGQVIH